MPIAFSSDLIVQRQPPAPLIRRAPINGANLRPLRPSLHSSSQPPCPQPLEQVSLPSSYTHEQDCPFQASCPTSQCFASQIPPTPPGWSLRMDEFIREMRRAPLHQFSSFSRALFRLTPRPSKQDITACISHMTGQPQPQGKIAVVSASLWLVLLQHACSRPTERLATEDKDLLLSLTQPRTEFPATQPQAQVPTPPIVHTPPCNLQDIPPPLGSPSSPPMSPILPPQRRARQQPVKLRPVPRAQVKASSQPKKKLPPPRAQKQAKKQQMGPATIAHSHPDWEWPATPNTMSRDDWARMLADNDVTPKNEATVDALTAVLGEYPRPGACFVVSIQHYRTVISGSEEEIVAIRQLAARTGAELFDPDKCTGELVPFTVASDLQPVPSVPLFFALPITLQGTAEQLLLPYFPGMLSDTVKYVVSQTCLDKWGLQIAPVPQLNARCLSVGSPAVFSLASQRKMLSVDHFLVAILVPPYGSPLLHGVPACDIDVVRDLDDVAMQADEAAAVNADAAQRAMNILKARGVDVTFCGLSRRKNQFIYLADVDTAPFYMLESPMTIDEPVAEALMQCYIIPGPDFTPVSLECIRDSSLTQFQRRQVEQLKKLVNTSGTGKQKVNETHLCAAAVLAHPSCEIMESNPLYSQRCRSLRDRLRSAESPTAVYHEVMDTVLGMVANTGEKEAPACLLGGPLALLLYANTLTKVY